MDQPGVGGNFIAGFLGNDIARDDLGGRNGAPLAIAPRDSGFNIQFFNAV
ncbi:MAG: hypothetical protein HYT38_00350 [Candidatus Sungbacteria bacterium]|uniref:Uncharacterized protein n=1 Tax=Candidatus Sungiibacteriota bacterium TaxID=2750080 RepID=A0A9D6HTN7_9BACT|nr:hypothetical protein [Candidatus Sungbacteria bacterium]